MAFFYFFQHDKSCAWIDRETNKTVPRYLRAPVAYEALEAHDRRRLAPYEGKKRFYRVSGWTSRSADGAPDSLARGASPAWLDEIGVATVPTIDDLPPGAGVYVSAYDGNVGDLAALEARNVSMIHGVCPWVERLRDELL